MKSKDTNVSLLTFIEQNIVEALSDSDSYKKICAEVLSLYRLMSPKLRFSGELRLRNCLKNSQIVVLAMCSYYMEPVLGCLIAFELTEIIKKRERSEDLLLLLNGRSVAFNFLLTSKRYSKQTLNNLFSKKNIENLLSRMVVKPVVEVLKHPKRLQRHKGYRDKGTLPEYSVRARREEVDSDMFLREEQVEKEEYLASVESFIQVHLAWLESLESHLFTDNYYFNKERMVRTYENDYSIRTKDPEKQRNFSFHGGEERKSREINRESQKEDRESGIHSSSHSTRLRSKRRVQD